MYSNQFFTLCSARFLTLLLTFLLNACALAETRSATGKTVVIATPSPEVGRANCITHTDDHTSATLDHEIEQFIRLSEQSLVYRQTSIEVAQRLNTQIDSRIPLSGADLELLHQGTHDYLAMRQQLWAVAAAHECWIDPPRDVAVRLDPQLRNDGILMSLSAALLLYDNYLLTVALFDQDSKLRRVLNQPDKGYSLPAHRLTEVKQSFLSTENNERIFPAVAYYKKFIEPDSNRTTNPERAYLLQLIKQSPSFAALNDNRMPADLRYSLRHMRVLSGDLLKGLSREGMNLFSMLFGNTVGLVETRRGKLYAKPELERQMAGQLRAGDVLLEKTPFRLTDLMIPGYWGHAAIWVGSETELRELGVWDHPTVRPHHEKIRRGKGVIEALRNGVVLNTFAHFLNVDDLAVLRPAQPDQATQAARVLRAFRQLGKAYDFNFDVESTDRIVCSELIYQVYTEITWPTSKQLGRATISPDQVAQRALPGGPLRVVLLAEDGRVVETEPGARMVSLLNRS